MTESRLLRHLETTATVTNGLPYGDAQPDEGELFALLYPAEEENHGME